MAFPRVRDATREVTNLTPSRRTLRPAGEGRYCDRFDVRFTRDGVSEALSVEWQIEAGIAVDTYEVGDGIAITVGQ